MATIAKARENNIFNNNNNNNIDDNNIENNPDSSSKIDIENKTIKNNKQNNMNYNNSDSNSLNKITIFDIPIEILFHIFTIENNVNYYNISSPIQINCRNINHNNNDLSINYNSYNKKQVIKMIINFSMTCKYFENIFQDDRFWFKSYKDYFSNYSLIDIDRKCLSSSNYTPISLSSSTTPTNISPALLPSSSSSSIEKPITNNNDNHIIIKNHHQQHDDKIKFNEGFNKSISIDDNDNENNINSNYKTNDNSNSINKEGLEEILNINYRVNLSWKNRFIKRNHPWNLHNLSLKKEIQQNKGITSLEVDNNYLFSGSHDTNINLYSLDDLKSKQVFKGHESTIWALKSDGKRLYSGSNDHTIRIWDLKSNQCKSIIRDRTKIFSIAIKDKLIVSSSDNNIKVWNRKSQQLVTTLRGHNGGINTIELKDQNLYSGSSDGSVGVWDLNQMKIVTNRIDPVDKILSLKLVNTNTLVTGSQNCQIKFWDLRQSHRDSPIVSLLNAHKWEVWQLEMCGGYLFSGSFDHTIKVWSLNNFQNLKTISSHRSYIHALTSSSFNLFSGSADKFIKIWKSDDII
ncbi:hypothetical protein DICPUDRAFT_50500 [Dictyostelium purpureum]|uniref:Uncharacterized protein n=1 Tax=Dictyostelium purpureum TaxID=5786 RepID=F0ZYQ1_DICPU|nr:uncharacterized protein DICPUDRAFT_50500 [Dictyostelium purpureum]EGC30916.1 hypothetical protein DICPUDRAFT_50500 [Dictyostelium purpureum]|eukprot:XP_003292545.1 hypothetical protein DICPUDRAFT_50500 [Dictyostelium purpureum]